MPTMVPCPICGQDDTARFRVYYDRAPKLYRCTDCGFVAQYPGPGSSARVDSYEEYVDMSWAAGGERWMYPDRARTLEDIADRIKAAGGGRKLLDVGCGDGQFISICREKGFDAMGVEDDRGMTDHARRQTGAEIVNARYSDEMFDAESFDVISFIQVMEHILDVRETLRIAHRHLRPGGILCIEVPSRFAPHFLAYRATRMTRFVDPPKGVIAEHIGYHHPGSVRRMTEAEGFEEIALTTGRWSPKYDGWKRKIGERIDPLLDRAGIGGILYLGRRV